MSASGRKVAGTRDSWRPSGVVLGGWGLSGLLFSTVSYDTVTEDGGDDHVQTQKDKGWKLPSLKINPALRKWQFQITRWNWESDELLAKRHVSARVTCFTDGKLNQQNMLRNTVSLDITNLNKKVDFTTVSARILKYLKIVSKYNIHNHTAD